MVVSKMPARQLFQRIEDRRRATSHTRCRAGPNMLAATGCCSPPATTYPNRTATSAQPDRRGLAASWPAQPTVCAKVQPATHFPRTTVATDTFATQPMPTGHPATPRHRSAILTRAPRRFGDDAHVTAHAQVADRTGRRATDATAVNGLASAILASVSRKSSLRQSEFDHRGDGVYGVVKRRQPLLGRRCG